MNKLFVEVALTELDRFYRVVIKFNVSAILVFEPWSDQRARRLGEGHTLPAVIKKEQRLRRLPPKSYLVSIESLNREAV